MYLNGNLHCSTKRDIQAAFLHQKQHFGIHKVNVATNFLNDGFNLLHFPILLQMIFNTKHNIILHCQTQLQLHPINGCIAPNVC